VTVLERRSVRRARSWFPLIERNPQSAVDVFKVTDADLREATQRIARSPRFPSHVELPVLAE
jgi:uncharacterized protein